MAKIKLLSPQEAQKIAAGEVVERPANIVKELIENALDAGATQISLYLEDGGRKLIRVTDNGCGMSAEDARLSIEHHATSKITSVQDLEQIATFGFRGEALSSIASVSLMTLSTKQAEDALGTCLEIAEGKITKESSVAMNTGTEIIIRDIFFNVPARQKFLKTKETEWRTILHLFDAFCLAYQQVSFTLYHDDRLIYTSPATNLLAERIAQLFEPAFSKNILTFEGSLERMHVRITGVCTNPHYTRFDRSHIFVFVQQRWVKNHKLINAFIKGYQNMLQPQKYPAGALFITLDPHYIDVNIHPRKEEVQFLHPKIIEDLIQETIQQALEKAHTQALSSNSAIIKVPERAVQINQDQSRPVPRYNFDNLAQNQPFIAAEKVSPQPEQSEKAIKSEEFLKILDQTLLPVTEDKQVAFLLMPQYRLIGQLKLTYLLIESQEGLILIDQHAAHERVLYERLRKNFDDVARIRLLFPQIIRINAVDMALFEEYLPLLSIFGMEVQRMSEHEIIITETPVLLKNQSLEDCIKQAISVVHEYHYLDRNELKKIILERVHAQLSCKAAVKAGDELSPESMHEIIKDLYSADNKLTCPHGRPTMWELKSGDIEKKFKRDYR